MNGFQQLCLLFCTLICVITVWVWFATVKAEFCPAGYITIAKSSGYFCVAAVPR